MEKELAKKAEVLKNLAAVSCRKWIMMLPLAMPESALELYEKLGDKQKIIRMHMSIQPYTRPGQGRQGARTPGGGMAHCGRRTLIVWRRGSYINA